MSSQRPGAAEAYDHMAPIYDVLNAQNDYEAWLGDVLLPELAALGLPGPSEENASALDIGCGTGRAFDPLLARGWRINGVDVSAAMLREAAKHRAASKDEGRVCLTQGDARTLPVFEIPFDLVLALNDVINYLTEDGDLELCFGGVARNLAPRGLFCFDANSLGLMRLIFSGERIGRGEWSWQGKRGQDVEPGGTFKAVLSGTGIAAHEHRQRHWKEDEIRTALASAGLICLARLGQREETGRIILSQSADEERDAKIIYIARPAPL